MKNALIILFILISLRSMAKHGDSLTHFNNVVVYENNVRVSRSNVTSETISYECTEYVLRYYLQIYGIDLYEYIEPSMSFNGSSVYFAAEFYREKNNGKVSSDGKMIMIGDPDELKVGDIIVYGRTEDNFSGHVAIYIGNNMEIGQNTSSPIEAVGQYAGILRYVGG